MLNKLLHGILGSANDRYIKQFNKIVTRINSKENWACSLADSDFKNQTEIFKERVSKGESLDDLLPEAFAVTREASKRVLGQRHYDVQMIGGIVLHNGMLAEMKTGEGKTLVATLPVYLNSLSGKGVHVVTVNDYLAQRDAAWMGQVYEFLGLKVGCILHGLSDEQRKEAYGADITYGTNHEFGFDYLRDNMKFEIHERVMRPFNYAIVDEVDSILIDEARTPLIISGPAEDSSELYRKIDSIMPKLIAGDFEKDEKQRTVILTEAGVEHVEEELIKAGVLVGTGLYDTQNINIVHHVNASLKAHKLFSRDVDYIVKDDEVVIIDEFTGRMMEGRRFSDGLHQAIEAKEHATIQKENQTLATITYQNFFRLYPKLSGMGGTIITEEAEFEEIYKLKAVEIPTNRPIVRLDSDDEVYLMGEDKYKAVVKLIKECQARQQPVLVGTTSIEKSEFISKILDKEQIKHEVLNANHHDKEALIISNAGKSGAITLSTNMAGRGTDIKLGGNLEARIQLELADVTEGREEKIELIKKEVEEDHEKVINSGGLFVIGTERHESRRIDNQLRGRSGRQGDNGASKFFISLEDDLMRIFGSGRMDVLLRKAGMKDGEAISHKWINKAIERAQKKVEAHNFEIRKHLLKYDDVMNDQRKVIYSQRFEIMESANISELIQEMKYDCFNDIVSLAIPDDSIPENWNLDALSEQLKRVFNITLPVDVWKGNEAMTSSVARNELENLLEAQDVILKEKIPQEKLQGYERSILLQILDNQWKEHLLHLDYLRQGINLRAYAQTNPLNEYKRESFNMFVEMMKRIKLETISSIYNLESPYMRIQGINDILSRIRSASADNKDFDADKFLNELLRSNLDEDAEIIPEINSNEELIEHEVDDKIDDENISRNALCPCGSGKRYKHCHGSAI